MKAFISISAEFAFKPLLSLPAFIRTLRVLKQNGVDDIYLVTPDFSQIQNILKEYNPDFRVSFIDKLPENTENSLFLSGSYHYDPDFIRFLLREKYSKPEEVFSSVSPKWWEKLDHETSFQNAEKKIFSVIHDKTEGWVAHGINKKISFPITKLLLKTKITPNQITFINLLIALFGAFFISSSSYLERFIGAFAVAFSSIFDGCDGELARIRVLSSKFGAWFDTIADDAANNLFWLGIFLGLYKTNPSNYLWYSGWINFILSLGVTAIIYHQLITAKKEGHAAGFQPVWKEEKKTWFDKVRPLMKRDFFIFVIFVCVLLDVRAPLFWVGCLATVVTFGLYFYSLLLSLFATVSPKK